MTVYKFTAWSSGAPVVTEVLVGPMSSDVQNILSKAEQKELLNAKDRSVLQTAFGKSYELQLGLGESSRKKFIADAKVSGHDTLRDVCHILKRSYEECYFWATVPIYDKWLFWSGLVAHAYLPPLNVITRSVAEKLHYNVTGQQMEAPGSTGHDEVMFLSLEELTMYIFEHSKATTFNMPCSLSHHVNGKVLHEYPAVPPLAPLPLTGATFQTLQHHHRHIDSFCTDTFNYIVLPSSTNTTTSRGNFVPYFPKYNVTIPLANTHDPPPSDTKSGKRDYVITETRARFLHLSTVKSQTIMLPNVFRAFQPDSDIPCVVLWVPGGSGLSVKVDEYSLELNPTFASQCRGWIRQAEFTETHAGHNAMIVFFKDPLNQRLFHQVRLTDAHVHAYIKYNVDMHVELASAADTLIKYLNTVVLKRLSLASDATFDSGVFSADHKPCRSHTRVKNAALFLSIRVNGGTNEWLTKLSQGAAALPRTFALLSTDAQKHTVHLLCKRANGYASNVQILQFIQRSATKQEASKLIPRLQVYFGMTKDTAISLYKNWKTYVKRIIECDPTAFHDVPPFTYVHVRPYSDNTVKVFIDGLQDMAQINCILEDVQRAALTKSTSRKNTNTNVVVNAGDFKELDDILKAFDGDSTAALPSSLPASSLNSAAGSQSATTLDHLYRADYDLFNETSDVKYARLCQKQSHRQPIVVSPDEQEKLSKPSYTNHLSTGSTSQKAHENVYICPEVWCPKSKQAFTRQQFVDKGKQCPLADENPYLFFDNYTKPVKTRYVGYLQARYHKKQLCMPCCFFTNRAKQTTCASSSVNNAKNASSSNVVNNSGMSRTERYIKGESTVPLDAMRLGLLPSALRQVFANSKEGHRADGTGSIGRKTNAFVRIGMQASRQPFLETMSYCLKKSISDIVAAFRDNLTIVDFISAYRGLLAKKLLIGIHPRDLANSSVYAAFKTKYLQCKQYHAKLDCGPGVLAYLERHKEFVIESDAEVVKQVQREYVLFSAFERFMEYLQNDESVKSHTVLLDLINSAAVVPWLNPERFAFAIVRVAKDMRFELDGVQHTNCALALAQGRPLVLLLQQPSGIYEPVVHVQANLPMTLVHSADSRLTGAIARTLKKVLSTDQLDELDAALNCIASSVTSVVLSYDFYVHGVTIQDKVYLPLPRPRALTAVTHVAPLPALQKFMFIDTAFDVVLSNQGTKGSARQVLQDVVERINANNCWAAGRIELASKAATVVGGVELHSVRVAGKEVGVTPMRATGFKVRQGAVVGAVGDMIDEFVHWQDADERAQVVKQYAKYRGLIDSRWNAVLDALQKNKDAHRELVSFWRNHSNPLPYVVKVHKVRAMLDAALGKRKAGVGRSSEIDGFVHERVIADLLNPIVPLILRNDGTSGDKPQVEQAKVLNLSGEKILNQFDARMKELYLELK